MSGRGDKASGDDGGGRGARLAEALRENLRRRKAQARSRRESAPLAADQATGWPEDKPAGGGSAGHGGAGEDSPRE